MNDGRFTLIVCVSQIRVLRGRFSTGLQLPTAIGSGLERSGLSCASDHVRALSIIVIHFSVLSGSSMPFARASRTRSVETLR